MGFFKKMGSFAFKNVFNPKQAAKTTIGEVGNLAGEAIGAFTSGMAGDQVAEDTTATDLEADLEATKKRKALAQQSLVQTSQLGAGKAQTQRKKITGV